MNDMLPLNLTGVSDMISNRRFRVARMRLTPLNLATTVAWLACQRAGTHRAGEDVTLTRPAAKQGYAAPFTVCANCGVPIAPVITWRINRNGEEAA